MVKYPSKLGYTGTQATDTKAGVTRFATDEEAAAGVLDNVAITPQDLSVAVDDLLPDATTTEAGKVRLATVAETLAGTSQTIATTPAGVAAVAIAGAPDASVTVKGIVELATDAEAAAKADTTRAITPSNLPSVLSDPGPIGDVTADTGAFSTLTLSSPLTVANGGTGLTTITDHGIMLGSGTGAITPLGAATNGQLPIGSTGADPVLAALTEGEAIDVTNGAGTITIACELATETNAGVLETATDVEAVAVTVNDKIVVPSNLGPVFAAPPAIGGTTPAAGAFTTLSATTPIDVASGGTGAATLTDHGVVLGSGVGAVTVTGVGTNGQVLVGSTGADPVFATIGSTSLTVTGGAGTLTLDVTAPLGVDTGGTGATSLTDHGVLVGSGTGAVTPLAVGTDGQLLVGSSGADPVFATPTSPNSTITITGGAGTFGVDVAAPLGVDTGGTGATSLTDHGILLGSGTGAITPTAVMTDGQLLVGSTGADPAPATLGVSNGLTATAGAGTLAIQITSWAQTTFTPELTPTGTAYDAITYTTQQGHYTRIGSMVIFSIFVQINSVTVGSATGDLTITGLPLAAAAAPAQLGMSCATSGIDLPNTPVSCFAKILATEQFVRPFIVQDNGAATAIAATGVANGDQIWVQGMYMV